MSAPRACEEGRAAAPVSQAEADRKVGANLRRRLRAASSLPTACLGVVLSRCRPARPCLSGACLTCGRELQKGHAALVEAVIRTPARAIRNRATALTLVPAVGCVEPGALSPDTFEAIREAVMAAAIGAGLGPTVFALDISFNTDREGGAEPYWMGHVHGTGLDWLSPAQDASLRRLCPSTDRIARPVKVDHLDGRSNWQDYAAKPDRFQRESYIVRPKRGSDRAPFRDTRQRPLRAEQAVELALVEHEFGLRGRVFTHGISNEVVDRHLGGWNWARDGP